MKEYDYWISIIATVGVLINIIDLFSSWSIKILPAVDPILRHLIVAEVTIFIILAVLYRRKSKFSILKKWRTSVYVLWGLLYLCSTAILYFKKLLPMNFAIFITLFLLLLVISILYRNARIRLGKIEKKINKFKE